MKKQPTTEIKNIFSDALYWSMSPKSKDKKYHLSRVHETVLRKLIHYDRSNTKITYSNEWISKHVFLDITQIEKSIPHLEKKGFINCITFSKRNKKGELVKSRIININWDFIKEVLSEVPKIEFNEKEADSVDKMSNEDDDLKQVSQEQIQNGDCLEIGIESSLNKSDFDINEYLTKRKLEYAKNFFKDDFNAEAMYTLDKEVLDNFFYRNCNIWNIKTKEIDKEDLWENIHGVNLSYIGLGSRLKLFTIDKHDVITDSFQLNWNEFNQYLERKKIKFGDVTLDNYETLKQFAKEPLRL